MSGEGESMAGLMTRGFVVTLPVLLCGLMVAKGCQLVTEWIHPLLDAMPGTVFQHPFARFCVVVLVVAALLMFVGWISRKRIGRSAGRWVEMALLSRLPFYNTLRTLASGLTGRDGAASMQPILVSMDADGLDQPGLLVDRFADGRAAVYLPSSPNPGSGTVVIVDACRLRELHVPMGRLLQCLGRWGQGTAALLEGARRGGSV